MAWNWDRDYKGDTSAGSYRATPAAPAADAGMEDFLASAKKLTDQFLDKSRAQAEQMLREARAQAERIVADAQLQAERILREAEGQAAERVQQARREADECIDRARAEAEQIRKDAIPAGAIEQEYAIQRVSASFDELRRRQEETLELLNAQWQKILIELMPADEPAAEPMPPAEPEPAPTEVESGSTAHEEEAAELPDDLEAKVSALSREMDELFHIGRN